MREPSIRVEGLSKRYTLGPTRNPRDGLRHAVETMVRNPHRWLRDRRQKGCPQSEEFWALRDVSFNVAPGEVIGIIGRNGAGKSTLLKILSRITEPTQGRVSIEGRVASLLEVGTGFHPELTGRENIFLNGAILGMQRAEIKRKFDEIVAFAEVEKFLDTPVKRYSSGMYVRLAFAVAAHLEPEILIVDEVLAVGDAEFQKKCLGKMQDVAKGEGRTVLFVSHNMGAVEQLCERALFLERGCLKLDRDDVRAVIHQYLSPPGAVVRRTEWETDGNKEFISTWFTPHRFRIVDSYRETLPFLLSNNDDVWIELEAQIAEFDPALNVGYAVYTDTNDLVYWSCHTDAMPQQKLCLEQGYNLVRTRLPKRFLNEGDYRIELMASIHNRFWILEPGMHVPTIHFQIQGGLSDSPFWNNKRPGMLAPVIPWDAVAD